MNLTTEQQAIVAQFEECVRTLRRIPGGINLGHNQFWPEVIYQPGEFAWANARPTLLKATPNQITRMEQALHWVTLVNEVERHLIWARAYQIPWRVICRQTGLPYTSARRYWRKAIVKLENLRQK